MQSYGILYFKGSVGLHLYFKSEQFSVVQAKLKCSPTELFILSVLRDRI